MINSQTVNWFCYTKLSPSIFATRKWQEMTSLLFIAGVLWLTKFASVKYALCRFFHIILSMLCAIKNIGDEVFLKETPKELKIISSGLLNWPCNCVYIAPFKNFCQWNIAENLWFFYPFQTLSIIILLFKKQVLNSSRSLIAILQILMQYFWCLYEFR